MAWILDIDFPYLFSDTLSDVFFGFARIHSGGQLLTTWLLVEGASNGFC